MATIALYAGKINQMDGLIKGIKKSVTDYKLELSALRNKVLTVDKSICDLNDVVNSVQASTQTQEQKISSLETISRESENFVSEAVRIDGDVATTVTQGKDDFYEKYSYLKPECEKNLWEKFCDGCKKVGEWCKEHWKLLVTVVVVIAAIAVIVCFPAAAPILLMAAKGAIVGAVSGGILGGLSSVAAGGFFWEGFEDGAFSGALMGALFGGIGGAGQMFANSCKMMSLLGDFGKAFKVMSCVSKISGGIAAAMGGFDLLSLGIKLFDLSNPLVMFNEMLHSSKVYNGFQFAVSAVAAFSGGAFRRMKEGPPICFVAGTMILTASGLKAIEHIRVGDMVVATDPKTFEKAEKTVSETYIHTTLRLVHLTVGGELITTTANHPFYVKGRGFVEAGGLRAGDVLLGSDGGNFAIERVYFEVAQVPETVYNFQVEDFHTYHVGNNAVLVHNAECGGGTEAYKAPGGGGGITSTIKANGQTVNFGHGGRHLEGTGLNVNAVNQALANEVSILNLSKGQFHKGQIVIDGITIEYTSYGVSDGIINIGTYYPLE